jgi:hypothetical protein
LIFTIATPLLHFSFHFQRRGEGEGEEGGRGGEGVERRGRMRGGVVEGRRKGEKERENVLTFCYR